jgi:sec-independent protein translocase protein TatA
MPFLFIFDSPTQIIFVVLILALLFGAGRLPQLAKSIGQSKKAFKEGLREGEEGEDWIDKPRDNPERPLISSTPLGASDKPLSAMTDEELEAEMARRSNARAEH